jgi:phosphatidate cytidylyltransferase
MRDQQTLWLVGGVLGVLILATGIAFILDRRATGESARATVDNLNARIRAWWVMCAVFSFGLFIGGLGPVVLFGLISFLALREFITLTPTRPGDHRSLFWVFFVITPLQYLLVGLKQYSLFSIMIPIYAFLLIPTRSAIAGDHEHFLERTAKIQWGLMVCVYCVSHAPALLTLQISGYEGQNARLLFFLVLVVQISDVLQYVCGKLLGKRKIAPHISPNKTWEGFLAGVGCATLIGTSLWWATPFSPSQAAGMSLAITLMGFAGGLTMSAIKRDRGVKDYGTLIQGHGGVLDRIDSICFAAPIFFHATRYLFT